MLPMFEVHTATVETYTGVTPTGDGYAAPVTVRGLLDDGLVRVKGSGGEELVQQTRFYAAPEHEGLFRPESRVTVEGRVAQVVRTRTRDAGTVFGSVAHVEVELR